MTVAFATASTTVSGTVSVAPTYPAGIVAGDILILGIINKYPTNGPTTPAGWALAAQASGGAGASGADSGSVYSTVYYRIADGTETGTLTVPIAGGNAALAQLLRYTKTETNWDIASTIGASNTPGTAWTVTGAADIGIQTGDLVFYLAAINTDTWSWSGTKVLSAPGVTFGARVQRAEGNTAVGDDIRISLHEYPAASGSSTGPPTLSMTATGFDANSPAGCTVFVRLREVTPSGTAATAASGSAGVIAKATIAGTGAATGAATGAISGLGAIAGTSAESVGASGSVVGKGAVQGTVPVATQATGALTGVAEGGATAPVVGGATGDVKGIAALAGTATEATAATGDLTGVGRLGGTTSVATGASGAATGVGTVGGTAATQAAGGATVVGVGEVAGTAGALVGAAAQAGLAGYVSGTANVAAGGSADVVGAGNVAGRAEVDVDASLELTGLAIIRGTADVHTQAIHGRPYVPRIVIRLRTTLERGTRLKSTVERGVRLTARVERNA